MDEAFAPFGIGAEIAAQLADRGFDDLDAPIRRLNGAHTPTPYSPPLEAAVVPNVDAIAQAIRDLVRRVRRRIMAIAITIPRLGWNMEEGVFVGWLKDDGDDGSRRGSPVHAGRATRPPRTSSAWTTASAYSRRRAAQGRYVAVGAVIGFVLQPGETFAVGPASLAGPAVPVAPRTLPGPDSARATD